MSLGELKVSPPSLLEMLSQPAKPGLVTCVAAGQQGTSDPCETQLILALFPWLLPQAGEYASTPPRRLFQHEASVCPTMRDYVCSSWIVGVGQRAQVGSVTGRDQRTKLVWPGSGSVSSGLQEAGTEMEEVVVRAMGEPWSGCRADTWERKGKERREDGEEEPQTVVQPGDILTMLLGSPRA